MTKDTWATSDVDFMLKCRQSHLDSENGGKGVFGGFVFVCGEPESRKARYYRASLSTSSQRVEMVIISKSTFCHKWPHFNLIIPRKGPSPKTVTF